MNNQAALQIVALALATSAISLTLARGKIFSPLREWVANRNMWFGDLLACFYCTSHWVGLVLVLVYQPILIHRQIAVDLFVSLFVLVAISALVGGSIIKLTSMGESEAPTRNRNGSTPDSSSSLPSGSGLR